MYKIALSLLVLLLSYERCWSLRCYRSALVTRSDQVVFNVSEGLQECPTNAPQMCIQGNETAESENITAKGFACVNSTVCSLPCAEAGRIVFSSMPDSELFVSFMDSLTISSCARGCCNTDGCNNNTIDAINTARKTSSMTTMPSTTTAMMPSTTTAMMPSTTTTMMPSTTTTPSVEKDATTTANGTTSGEDRMLRAVCKVSVLVLSIVAVMTSI